MSTIIQEVDGQLKPEGHRKPAELIRITEQSPVTDGLTLSAELGSLVFEEKGNPTKSRNLLLFSIRPISFFTLVSEFS